jgi:hypothetical protein
MSVHISVVENNGTGSASLDHYEVVGYALVEVRRKDGGELAIEFDVKVDCDSKEDGELVLGFIKKIESKVKEALPKPEFMKYPEVPEAKLWVPE